MNINIKEQLVRTLNRLAEERSMTPEVYVEEYLDNHLTSQYRAEVVAKVSSETVENVAEIDQVIETKKAEIKAEYDLANPVIELRDITVEPIEEIATTTDKIIK
jgi:hypothetical protein